MDIETEVEDRQWYVLHTKPKQEERANSNLIAWGVETLHPKLKTRRHNEFTGRSTYITQPLFPRYIFAKFNARKQLSKILFTRGVHNVVCFGDSPASVSKEIIDLIRARIDQNGFVKASHDLKPGDRVVISAGPLRNLTGVFEREIKGSERSMILLVAIGYQGHLDVD
jgi:transcriptional antiterminator RfaH